MSLMMSCIVRPTSSLLDLTVCLFGLTALWM